MILCLKAQAYQLWCNPSICHHRSMPIACRFTLPWIVDEHNNACFIVKAATAQALGYFYFEDEPGRR